MKTAVLVDTHYAHAEQIRRKIDWKALELQLFLEYSDINWLEKAEYMHTDVLILGYLTFCSISDLIAATTAISRDVAVIVVDQQIPPHAASDSVYSCGLEQFTPNFLMQILAKASAASGEENVLGRVEEPTDAEPTAVQKLAELAVARTDFFLLRVLFRGGPSPAEAPHIGDFFHRVFDDLLIDWFWEENGAICVLIADTPQMSILYSVRIIGDMIHQLYRELTDGGYRLYPILMSEKTNKQQCIAAYQGLLETEKSCLFCPDRVVLTVSQVRSANAEADEGFLEEQILRFRQHLIAGEAMPAIHHLDLLYHQGIAPTLDPNLLTHCRRQIQMAFDLYALLEKMPSYQRWTPHADGTLEEEYEQLRTWIASHLTSEAAQPGLHPKIRSALQYMLQHYSEDISQESMAQRLGLSPPYFSKLFKMDTGRGFVELLMDLRMEQARSLFDAGQSNVQQVASRVGFHDPKYFSRVFRKKCGKSPAQYLAERNLSEREEGAAE